MSIKHRKQSLSKRFKYRHYNRKCNLREQEGRVNKGSETDKEERQDEFALASWPH